MITDVMIQTVSTTITILTGLLAAMERAQNQMPRCFNCRKRLEYIDWCVWCGMNQITKKEEKRDHIDKKG